MRGKERNGCVPSHALRTLSAELEMQQPPGSHQRSDVICEHNHICFIYETSVIKRGKEIRGLTLSLVCINSGLSLPAVRLRVRRARRARGAGEGHVRGGVCRPGPQQPGAAGHQGDPGERQQVRRPRGSFNELLIQSTVQ